MGTKGKSSTTWGKEKRKIISERMAPKSGSTKECAVCRETLWLWPSYDTYTCKFCRQFFRKQLKTKTTPPCVKERSPGHCEVTAATREHCDQCRFQRCLALGMDKWSIAKSTPLRLKREELYDKIGVWFHSQGREVPFDECYHQVQVIATEIGYSTAKLKEKYVRDFIYRHLAREYRLKKGTTTTSTTTCSSNSASTPRTSKTTKQAAVTTTTTTTTPTIHYHHNYHQTELHPTIYQNTVPVHYMPIFRNSIEFA